jgi:UDP-N-acetylmuramoyl-tripeptide--D-alanyl-D-alanine ligase
MNKTQFFQGLIPEGKKLKLEKINEIKIDSRTLKKNDVFFAIRGGNNYVIDALNKGVTLVFYDSKELSVEDERAIYVEDTVTFLQEAARKYRESLDVIVIGITGSEGKTSTKDIIYSILSTEYVGKKTLGNYNNHIGLPLMLFTLGENDKFIALEMGMSSLGEIRKLCEISKPDYAVITNIGDSHLEYLKNRDNVFKAKTEILEFVSVENTIVYGDDEYLKNLDAIKVGEGNENKYRIVNFSQDKFGSKFQLVTEDRILEIKTNLYGKYNGLNTGIAIALGVELGISEEKIKRACKNLNLSKRRFERIEKYNKIFIDDSYNASPVAMKAFLETFNVIFEKEYKVAILGDMLELGENSTKLHEELEETIKKLNLKELFLVGEEMRYLYEKLKRFKFEKIAHFKNVEEAREEVKKIRDGAAVLLKASNGISLSKILD